MVDIALCNNWGAYMRALKFLSIHTLTPWVIAIAALGAISNARAGGTEIKLETSLIAPAVAGDVSGKAKFENKLQEGLRKFSIQVEGFVPGQMFDVTVKNQVVGKIVINTAGIGDINFDSNFEAGVDDPATMFPPNFPALEGGESIDIGPLNGSLQPK